jgi:hypothetical protein
LAIEQNSSRLGCPQSESLGAIFQNKKRKLERKHCDEDINREKMSLAKWAIEAHIPKLAVNKLLCILQQFTIHTIHNLPLDMRSSVLQFRNHIKITLLEPGHLAYIGIKEMLQLPNCRLFNQNDSVMKLTINVDSLPAFNTVGKGFWPILGRVMVKSL